MRLARNPERQTFFNLTTPVGTMGDSRYDQHLDRLMEHGPNSLGELADDELIQAIAALAARVGGREAYLANILASEVMNRLARAHAAVMHSMDGLLAVDLDGAGVFANPAAQEMLGWTQQELRGVHVHTLVHDRDGAGACALEGSLEGASSTVRDRSRFTRKDGTTFDVEYSIAPVNREGERHGAVLAFHSTKHASDDS